VFDTNGAEDRDKVYFFYLYSLIKKEYIFISRNE